MTIWDDADVDWSAGEGLRAAQLFERAYPDTSEARDLAEALGLAWPSQSAVLGHGELWVELLTAATRDGRRLDLAAALLADSGRAAFVSPLHQLLGAQLGAANARRVGRYGLPVSAADATAVVESLDPARTADAILPGGGLESINRPGAGMQSFAVGIQVWLDARRRVVLIRRGLSPVGTGFLVGPDLLLTAAHVVNPRQAPAPADLDRMDAVLDFSGGNSSIAETGSPVPVIGLLRASTATDAELAGGMLATWDAPDDRLDYALLRLGRRVGDDATPDTDFRGWYRLEDIEPDLSRSTHVTVFHFPLGSFLSTSQLAGAMTYNASGTKTRLRYRTNTLPGSSGAPMVDESGRLLAVHHFGDTTANQAVPAWRITEKIRDLLPAHPPPTRTSPPPDPQRAPPDAVPAGAPLTKPYEVLQVGPRPVVNRGPLRQKLWSAMTRDDAARSLVIMGTVDSGISWSWHLLSHLAANGLRNQEIRARAPQGVQAIDFDLRKHITRTAAERRAELIKIVCRRVAGEVSDEWVAQAAREVSEFKDWCYQRLVNSDRQWWLFIDSIDEAGDVDRNGMGEVLAALVDLADDPQVNLRLVLAGRAANLVDHPSIQWAETDNPVGLSRDEVRTWLEARVREAGRTPKSELVDDFLAEWFGPSGQADRPVELTLALPRAVEKVGS